MVNTSGVSNETDSATIVSTGSDKRRLSRRTKIIVAVLLVICLIAAGVTAFIMTRSSDVVEVKLEKGDALTSQVDNLDEPEIAALAGSKVDPKEDLEQAYARGLALSRQDKHKEAASVLKDVVATGKARYYVYTDYGLIQARAGDFDAGIKTLQTAIDKLKSDELVSDDVKNSQARYLNNLLIGLKDEAQN